MPWSAWPSAAQPFDSEWRGKHYAGKQIEAYCVEERGDWLVITVIVKYFGA